MDVGAVAAAKAVVRQLCGSRGEPEPVGASLEDIRALGVRMGLIIPPDVVDWLHWCNGSLVAPGGLYGIRPDDPFLDIEICTGAFPQWGANGWIGVAADGSGDFYVVEGARPGAEIYPVYFVDQEDYGARNYVVASGIWPFVRFLLTREFLLGDPDQPYWPFDRDTVLREDPDLLRYQGDAPLPWDTG